MRKSIVSALAGLGVASLTLAASALATDTNVKTENGRTKVEAPYTRVDSNAERTKVRVNVPDANVNVKVDTETRHVRIRVPYYSGDIRW